MKEKYYLLESVILFKLDMTDDLFYRYDTASGTWLPDNGAIMSRFYDAAYDVTEIRESDLPKVIEAIKKRST